MRRDYDIFEKLPDGSTVWLVRVPGQHETQRKISELSENSTNPFYELDIVTGEEFPPALDRRKSARGD